MLEKMWRKGNISILTVGMYVGVAPVENSMEVPQKRIIHMIQQSHSWIYIQTKL